MKYLKFIKIEHTLFSLPVVFSGTLLAVNRSDISLRQILWITLAVMGARAAGFGFNRILDARIDAQNERTSRREIPAGKISKSSAWLFTWGAAVLFSFSAYQLAPLCLWLSFIPICLFLIYPYLKRVSMWCHLWLGFSWGTAPLGGWLAVSPHISPIGDMLPALLLSGFCVFWVAGFDIIYALLDEKFDREHGVFSIPARLGTVNALRFARIFHFISALFLGVLTQLYLNKPISFIFLGFAGILLLVSHFRVENEPLSPPVIDFAFFKVNAALAFVIFLMVLVK